MPFVAGFRPSTSAPLFRNGPWPPAADLTVTVPGLPTVSVAETPMGLSGGMAFLARDLFESGAPQLRQADPGDVPATLVRHLRHRLIHSFLGDGVVEQWLRWTAAPDHSTWLLGDGVFPHTVRAARTIMALLDEGVLCPIGVVLTSSPRPRDVFANHVALVYGYQLHGRRLTLHVYDCNRPGHDGITISLDIGSAAPVSPVVTNGTNMTGAPGRVRGFFLLPYQQAGPATGRHERRGGIGGRIGPAHSYAGTTPPTLDA